MNDLQSDIAKVDLVFNELEGGGLNDGELEAWQRIRAALQAPPAAAVSADAWIKLYRRAMDVAGGLTNYIEDRPELRDAERKLDAIERDARAMLAAAERKGGA